MILQLHPIFHKIRYKFVSDKTRKSLVTPDLIELHIEILPVICGFGDWQVQH